MKDTAIHLRRSIWALLFGALAMLLNPAARAHYHSATLALWPEGATAFTQRYQRARRAQQPLLVYLQGPRDERIAAAIQRPEMRRLLTRFDAVQVNASHGPAARRIAERLHRVGSAPLYVLLPGSGLAPRRVDAANAAAVIAAVAGLYRAQAHTLTRAGRSTRAARALTQARSFNRYAARTTMMN